ncbi:MAG TPA: cupin domain-containing protein [Candidatus Paceibacterota bacterium]
MQILKKGHSGVAVIDPKKRAGEPGQYVKWGADDPDLALVLSAARSAGCEIRYYFNDVKTIAGEVIPLKIVVTEIPPGHVQPFHIHETVHEVSVVNEGTITEIESDVLEESDVAVLKKAGTKLSAGDTVVDEPEKRHTIANFTRKYAKFTTTQSARMAREKFSSDWKR